MEKLLEILKKWWDKVCLFFDPRPKCWGCKELLGPTPYKVVLRAGPGAQEMSSYEICDSCERLFSKIQEKTGTTHAKSASEDYD